MSTFVIGDIHGCFETFQTLLEKAGFDADRDRLWLVGDLINGGPDSAGVLRWVRKREKAVTCVLGNHDIYGLARYWGVVARKRRDNLKPLFKARDAEKLMNWLRRRPLIHRENGVVLVHAGLAPQWSVPQAERLSRKLEAQLCGPGAVDFLRRYFTSPGGSWSKKLRGKERLICALRILTMIRTCRSSGSLCLGFSGPPEDAPAKCVPWYQLREADDPTFYFGHWAALGYRQLPHAVGLDSGCVWGGPLTAVRLEDGRVYQVENLEN